MLLLECSFFTQAPCVGDLSETEECGNIGGEIFLSAICWEGGHDGSQGMLGCGA